nr:uncharacterized protein LOC117275283 [Nicotiana tomentosiformis]
MWLLMQFQEGSNSRKTSIQEEGNDSIHGSSTSLKEKGKALKAPRRPMPRSRRKKFQDNLNGLQLAIKKCLVIEEQFQHKEDLWAKSYNYLEAQIKVQEEIE